MYFKFCAYQDIWKRTESSMSQKWLYQRDVFFFPSIKCQLHYIFIQSKWRIKKVIFRKGHLDANKRQCRYISEIALSTRWFFFKLCLIRISSSGTDTFFRRLSKKPVLPHKKVCAFEIRPRTKKSVKYIAHIYTRNIILKQNKHKKDCSPADWISLFMEKKYNAINQISKIFLFVASYKYLWQKLGEKKIVNSK